MTLIHPSTFHEQQNCRTSEDILVYFQKKKRKKRAVYIRFKVILHHTSA